MSKETMRKSNSLWRVAARIQNIFSSSPETMADTYFQICTSKEPKDVTGKFINDQREIMKVSSYSGELIQGVRQFLDKGVYPRYADNVDNIAKVWDLVIKLTKLK